MKYLLYILSILLLLSACGCGRKDNKQSNLNDSDFTIEQERRNPFNTNNKDSLFNAIEIAVDFSIKTSALDYDSQTKRGYLLWDSITKEIYNPENFVHSSDSDWALHENGILEYLNWHLWKILVPFIGDQSVVNRMQEEIEVTDSLLKAQYEWFRNHFDATQQWIGTAQNLKYYSIENEMLRIQNQNMQEILEAVTDSTYNKSVPHKIPMVLLEREYNNILTNRIPYYENDSIYNEAKDRASFMSELEIWTHLLRQRQIISNIIRKDAKTAFNIGTYRLMFNRLRQLKNEFEAYGSISSDMRSVLFSDSCTYDELMEYPNFTTKWNEYLKQFE